MHFFPLPKVIPPPYCGGGRDFTGRFCRRYAVTCSRVDLFVRLRSSLTSGISSSHVFFWDRKAIHSQTLCPAGRRMGGDFLKFYDNTGRNLEFYPKYGV
jgi:hypothetical protein